MTLSSYIPPPPLSAFVERFWHYESSAPAHGLERVLPTGAMQLVIHLGGDEIRVYDRHDPRRATSFGGAVLSGAHATWSVIDMASQRPTLGVAFHPGGAFPFLGLPAGELRDANAPLDALWGAGADALRERLIETPTLEARFGIIERALLARATRPLVHHPAVALALHEFRRGPDAPSVGEVTARVGLSARRFIELFTGEVGLPPKLYCRVGRFQRALRLIGDGRPVAWADLALTAGYYDQAHLARDFRAFCGLPPTAYLARRGESQNHVVIPR